MRAALVLKGALIAAALPSAAEADWQYTRWSMSEDQVVSASNGTASRVVFDPNSVDVMLRDRLAEIEADAPRLRSEYNAGGRTYEANFHFRSDKLDRVSLSLRSPTDCYKLRGELLGQYGPAAEQYRQGSTLWWRDTARGNHVMLSVISESDCTITYEPLKAATDNGL